MAEFINTIDVLGDDAVVDSIIDRTITEFKDNAISKIGSYAFKQCKELSVVELPNVETLEQYAFEDCVSLERVYLPRFATKSNVNGLFTGCTALTDVHVPLLQYVGWSMFRYCYNLEKIDLPCVTFINALAFSGKDSKNTCKLKALILRSETLCGLGTTSALGETAIESGTGYIYVPRDLVDSYKTATNWSTYATQFRALEDYTVDGSITGKFAFANIRYVLEHVTSSNTETFVTGSYTTVLAIKGVNPVVSIIMDGVDITNDVYNEDTGEIVIPAVSGDIVITATSQIDQTSMSTLYELPEATSFNGTSDYIDTGIKLFDTAKDFTIVCSADFSALASNICLFHCMNEVAPYPGVSLDGNSGVRICYIGDRSVTTSISNKADVKALALRFKAGALDAIRYKNASGEIVTVAHNTTAKYAEVTQNLLLGAYQTTAGVKGRYYKGTINSFVVYDLYLDENMIEYALTVA